jgi:hypothetical protein
MLSQLGPAVAASVAPMIDQKNLKRILLRNGQPGRSTGTVQYCKRPGASP